MFIFEYDLLWVGNKLLASANRRAEVVAVQGLARRSASRGKGNAICLALNVNLKIRYLTSVVFLIGVAKHENHRAAIPVGKPTAKKPILLYTK
jgi:hypothetical protein